MLRSICRRVLGQVPLSGGPGARWLSSSAGKTAFLPVTAPGSTKIMPGTQSFKELAKPSIAFVDKTAGLVDLIDPPYDCAFLARPRKWGKSVTVNTLGAFFRNQRELFEGMAIYDHEGLEWAEYPVVQLDFSSLEQRDLRLDLAVELAAVGSHYGVTVDTGNVTRATKSLFTQLAAKSPTGKIVLLVDEYDAPITKLLELQDKTSEALVQENLEVLHNFFTVAKSRGDLIRFQFVTGVSKFVKGGVFSGVNHLTDISLNPRFSSLLGFTWADIERTFAPHLTALGEKERLDPKPLRAKITKWYNGYSWCGPEAVYNPYSICRLLSDQSFEPYWVQAGTPGWLLRHLSYATVVNTAEWDSQDLQKSKFDEIELNTLGKHSLDTTNLLLRTGYLTVTNQRVDAEGRSVLRLDYPNFEVRHRFLPQVIRTLLPTLPDVTKFQQLLDKDDVVGFFKYLSEHSLSSTGAKEGWFHSIVHVILRQLGVRFPSERMDASGQLDVEIPISGGRSALVELKSAAIGPKDSLAELHYEEKTGCQQIAKREPSNGTAPRYVVIFSSKPPRTLLKIVSAPLGREKEVVYERDDLVHK